MAHANSPTRGLARMSADAARAAILDAVCAVPPGEVAGYGQLAARAGLPRRARLVARVLSQLPDGSGIPWHRVLRSDGRIAFAPGSEGFRRQRELLLAEGCRVGADGRVQISAQRAGLDLDAAIWG